MRDKRIFTFGELMLRISPQHQGVKIDNTKAFRIEPGGSESNVAVALAMLGHNVSFISKIGDSFYKKIALRYLRGYNVDTSYIVSDRERMGIYWTECGIGPRASKVSYDRENSSFYKLSIDDFNWNKINRTAFWFHCSGITPGISLNLSKALISILERLNPRIKVSIDLNYRGKLWQWASRNRKKEIQKIMQALCSRAHLITANESDFQEFFGYPHKPLHAESYKIIAEDFFKKIKGLAYIAVSLRRSYSASDNSLSGLFFARKKGGLECFTGPEYRLNSIVDRVGTGDSFTAGVIHGISRFNKNFQTVVDFAVTLYALNHTVLGDASQFDEKEILDVLASKGSGRIIR